VLVDTTIAFERGRLEPRAPRLGTWLVHTLELRQEWRMWQRPLENRYYVFPARMDNGSEIDLHTCLALDWDAPRVHSRNNHWWKYQDVLSRPLGRGFRTDYASFLAREWERAHPRGPRIEQLSLVVVTGPPQVEPKSRLARRILWQGPPPPR